MNHEDNNNETIIFLPPIREEWSVIKKGIYNVIEIGGCLKIDFQGIGIWIGAVPGKEGCPYDEGDYHYKHVHLSIGIDDFSISAHEHYDSPDFRLYNGENIKGEKKEKYAEITTPEGPIFLIPKTVEWTKYWNYSRFQDKDLYEKECDEFYMVIGAKEEDIERLIEEYGGIDKSEVQRFERYGTSCRVNVLTGD